MSLHLFSSSFIFVWNTRICRGAISSMVGYWCVFAYRFIFHTFLMLFPAFLNFSSFLSVCVWVFFQHSRCWYCCWIPKQQQLSPKIYIFVYTHYNHVFSTHHIVNRPLFIMSVYIFTVDMMRVILCGVHLDV